MKTDLSSQIKLDRSPRRYYDPANEIELAALSREEKIDTRIYETATDGADYIAGYIVKHINRYIGKKDKCVMALGVGNGTLQVYSSLVRLYKEGQVDFTKVVIFNMAEFFPLDAEGPSTMARLNDVLIKHINIKGENVHTFDPHITKENMYDF